MLSGMTTADTTTMTTTHTAAAVDSPRKSYKSCRILYATQSGRARSCARRASRILQQQASILVTKKATTFDEAIGLRVSLQEFCQEMRPENSDDEESIKAESASNELLLLFVSTTGDGEHCDTIQHTWQQLRKKSLPNDLFHGITIAIFNLGDRAYGPQFCAAGRKLTIRLLQLGATMLCEPGYGDDGTAGGGVFADLDVWLDQQLLTKLLLNDVGGNGYSNSTANHASSSLSPTPSQLALPYEVSIITSTSNNEENGPQKQEEEQRKEEEWQLERFASSYQAFFARLAPFNAYAYDSFHHRLPINRTTTPNQDNDHNDSGIMVTSAQAKQQQQPLLARVVQNDRITALDWEQQDTRHVRLILLPDEDNNIVKKVESTATSTTITTNDDVLPSQLPYQAGDVASIMPGNTAANVDRFLAVLPAAVQELANVELEIQNTTSYNSVAAPGTTTSFGINGYDGWPRRCTLRGWLTYCADIHALPDREDLYALSHYCSPSHDMGREQSLKLQSLSESSGAALYNDYILREKRSWADVLYDFDSLRAPGSLLTIPALLALLSPIRPREFSIASSPLWEYQRMVQRKQQQPDDATATINHHDGKQEQPQQGFGIDLCVAVVRGTTSRGRKYHGLCSHYTSQLQATNNEGERQQQQSLVRIWIRPGSFSRMPLQTTVDSHGTQRFVQPVLYIGAGTGIAPLRGLIQERQAQLTQAEDSSSSSGFNTANANEEDDCWKIDDILLFGCRQEKSDYYYQSEWQTLQDHGRLKVLTAFSQDQWHKIYVQQVLRRADPTGKNLATHIEKAGCVYIAGGPKMASAVKEEIVELLTKQLGGNEKQVQQLLVRLQRAGRFSVEAWS